MERGSNLNISDFCKGTLSHYAVCNNNTQCIELWVQLGRTVNYHEPIYMSQCLMAVVMEVVHIYFILTHCGRVTQICIFNTVNLVTSASSPYCHNAKGNVSRGITTSSTTRIFGEYFLKISVHKNS